MKKYILLTLGFLFIILAYILNFYSLFRLLLLGLGILGITLSYVFKENRNIFVLVLIPLLLLIGSYAIDTLLFVKLNRVPIYVYEIKSNAKVSTYNSFFYRIYNCNKELVFDKGYKKSYVCGIDDLDTIDINAFLSEALENYKKYDNKFVKIHGKISKISGTDTIELSFYEKEEDILNGHVKFGMSPVLRIKTNSDLSNYRIYDEFTVIGLVENTLEENDVTVINLTNSILLPSDIYDTYSLEIIPNNEAVVKEFVKDKKYYLYGLDNIFVNYGDEYRYELSYSITDSRIDVNELIKGIDPVEIKENEDVIAHKYSRKKLDVVVCHDKTYFVNSNLKFDINLCKD